MAWQDEISPTWNDRRFPRDTPTLTVLEGLRSSLDAALAYEEIDTTSEISLSDVTDNSIKVAWSSENEKSELYDLQWQLDGSATWQSLPDPLSVPKVRFDHLAADTRISFRVRKKSTSSAAWSAFSRVATFKTLAAPRSDTVPSNHRKSNGAAHTHQVRILGTSQQIPLSITVRLHTADSVLACRKLSGGMTKIRPNPNRHEGARGGERK
jgi:hypothetical protein